MCLHDNINVYIRVYLFSRINNCVVMEYKLRNNIFLKDKLARLKYQQIKLKLRFPISYFMKVFNQKVY